MPLQRRLLQPLYSRVLTSPAVRQAWRSGHDWLGRVTGRPPLLQVWLRLDCPASYLLAQKLPRLHEHYPVRTDIRLLPPLDGVHPARLLDAWQLAQRHQLPFHGLTPPAPAACLLAGRIIRATAGLRDEERLVVLRQLFACVWEHQAGKLETLALRFPPGSPEEDDPGHPDSGPPSATLVYRGERFEGLDDLPLLVSRLEAAGLGEGDPCDGAGAYGRPARQFLVNESEMLAEIRSRRYRLDYYFCFRDPYSYLNLDEAFALADHYGLRLRLHPVTLPDMTPAGDPGALAGTRLLWRCVRRAEALGLPFGSVCLPDAQAVRHAHALLGLAREHGAERVMARELLARIWARGQDIGSARVRRDLLRTTGLDKEVPAPPADAMDAAHRHWLALDQPCLPSLVLHADRPVTAAGDDRAWALDMALADTLNP